jgi:hypothetical protein
MNGQGQSIGGAIVNSSPKINTGNSIGSINPIKAVVQNNPKL